MIFSIHLNTKEGLVNIVTGKVVTDPGVNVNDSSQIGKIKMKDFESSLPQGLYKPNKQTVKKMDNSRRE